MRFDPELEQFYCTNMDARWDRVGRVVTRPPGAAHSVPLSFAFAKRAWDGHVVIVGGMSAPPPSGTVLKSLWPGWGAPEVS
jgi:hypothetical protein